MQLVENWRQLWRAGSVQVAAIGAVLPELLQLVASNSALLPGLSQSHCDALRLACLLAIPVLRAIRQPDIHQPPG